METTKRSNFAIFVLMFITVMFAYTQVLYYSPILKGAVNKVYYGVTLPDGYCDMFGQQPTDTSLLLDMGDVYGGDRGERVEIDEGNGVKRGVKEVELGERENDKRIVVQQT